MKNGTSVCNDYIETCDCTGFRDCGSCMEFGYCGWCSETKMCYPLGDRPGHCNDFHEETCSEKLSLAVEYRLLVTIIAVSATGFLLMGVILIFKYIRGRRLNAAESDEQESLRTLNGSSSIFPSDTDGEGFGTDEDEGLLTSRKKSVPSSPMPFGIGKLGKRLRESTDKFFGTTPK